MNIFKKAFDSEFALFDNSYGKDQNEISYLFYDKIKILQCNSKTDIPIIFTAINKARKSGYYVVGYMQYEAAYLLEEKLFHLFDQKNTKPLIHFAIFKNCHSFKSYKLNEFFNQNMQHILCGMPYIDNLSLNISNKEYAQNIKEVFKYLKLGETYQLNYTNSYSFHYSGKLLLLYKLLRTKQPVKYGALLSFDGAQIISLSPELFFAKKGSSLTVKPMKGTTERSQDKKQDLENKKFLTNDEKNKAENLIIVDLLRNDLAKIATPGTINVSSLFDIETYQTVYQMTSTIEAKVDPELEFYRIIKGLFPCGSITGAPKFRTMEIIRQLEKQNRGVYTGSIGFILPNNDMCFNVAIRTIELNENKAKLGVGGGITIASDPEDEWQEMQLKANFLINSLSAKNSNNFQLIETIKYHKKYDFLYEHLERLNKSAKQLGFIISIDSIYQNLVTTSKKFDHNKIYKIRILLEKNGIINVTHNEIPLNQHIDPINIYIYPNAIPKSDLWQHKTNAIITRGFYTNAQKEYSTNNCELVFKNDKGIITESAIYNIIIKHQGKMLTSPISSGLLPGIYRDYLLKNNTIIEHEISVDMLAESEEIWLCNSVRGMQKAIYSDADTGEVK